MFYFIKLYICLVEKKEIGHIYIERGTENEGYIS